MVGIRAWLQMNSGVAEKLTVWLPREGVVQTFLICGPGTVECTRRTSLGNGEERVDWGKLVVTRK